MTVGKDVLFFSGGAEKETFFWFKKKEGEKVSTIYMVLNDDEKDSRRLLSIYSLGKIAQINL